MDGIKWEGVGRSKELKWDKIISSKYSQKDREYYLMAEGRTRLSEGGQESTFLKYSGS